MDITKVMPRGWHERMFPKDQGIRPEPIAPVDSEAGLTAEERRALRLSAELYNLVHALGNHHPSDMEELVVDIHRIQNRIMARLARRAHPELFRG